MSKTERSLRAGAAVFDLNRPAAADAPYAQVPRLSKGSARAHRRGEPVLKLSNMTFAQEENWHCG